MDERTTLLYGLVGRLTTGESMVPFGGYFQVDIQDGKLTGSLVDSLRRTSTIQGRMFLHDLIFTKTYENEQFQMHFDFTRESLSNGFWQGRFAVTVPNSNRNNSPGDIVEVVDAGLAECQTTLVGAISPTAMDSTRLVFPNYGFVIDVGC